MSTEKQNLVKCKTVKPRKLNLGFNVRINERVMCASVGDPRPRDRELGHQNTATRRFLHQEFINLLPTQNLLDVET